MPEFAEFSRQDGRAARQEEPMFTLQVRGLISFNQAAYKELGEPAAVALLYDARAGIVALRNVPKEYENAYLIRSQQNSRSYLVGAEAFTRYHKITTEVAHRYQGHNYGNHICGFVLSEGAPARRPTRTH